GASYRQCDAWLGPNQPGVNETDPTNPSACVPDPGGAPLGKSGPATGACKLSATARASSSSKTARKSQQSKTVSVPSTLSSPSSTGGGSSGGLAGINLKQTVTGIVGALTGAVGKTKPTPQPAPSSSPTTGSGSSGS